MPIASRAKWPINHSFEKLGSNTAVHFNSLILDLKKGKYVLKVFMVTTNSENSKICAA